MVIGVLAMNLAMSEENKLFLLAYEAVVGGEATEVALDQAVTFKPC